jgi:hypothetical protein
MTIFWIVVIISIFAVLILMIWFIRRSSRARYNKKGKSIEKTKLDMPDLQILQKDSSDKTKTEMISENLQVVRDYYDWKTVVQPVNKKEKVKKNITQKQLKSNLDKILDYIEKRLNYFRKNYGKELIEEDYIMDTILKFGNSSIEQIINYKAISFALGKIYPGNSEKRSEVDKLFRGAADLLNSKELDEIIKNNAKK